MAITRQKKEDVVKDVGEKLSKAKVFLFMDYRGMKVKDMNAIRKEFKRNGIDFQVVKKTLLKRICGGLNLPFEQKILKGQIAIITGYEDEVRVPQTWYRFFRESGKPVALGGYLDGSEITKDEIIALAKLPSREDLIGKVAFLIASPLTQFIRVLNGNMRNLTLVLDQIQKTK